ncbi:MAG: hypothetical protein ACRD1W_01155 [Vicinamibacterales bacterium]
MQQGRGRRLAAGVVLLMPIALAAQYQRGNVACVTRGQWDGGSDDDPAAPPADPYRITVLCADAAAVIRPR